MHEVSEEPKTASQELETLLARVIVGKIHDDNISMILKTIFENIRLSDQTCVWVLLQVV